MAVYTRETKKWPIAFAIPPVPCPLATLLQFHRGATKPFELKSKGTGKKQVKARGGKNCNNGHHFLFYKVPKGETTRIGWA